MRQLFPEGPIELFSFRGTTSTFLPQALSFSTIRKLRLTVLYWLNSAPCLHLQVIVHCYSILVSWSGVERLCNHGRLTNMNLDGSEGKSPMVQKSGGHIFWIVQLTPATRRAACVNVIEWTLERYWVVFRVWKVIHNGNVTGVFSVKTNGQREIRTSLFSKESFLCPLLIRDSDRARTKKPKKCSFWDKRDCKEVATAENLRKVLVHANNFVLQWLQRIQFLGSFDMLCVRFTWVAAEWYLKRKL